MSVIPGASADKIERLYDNYGGEMVTVGAYNGDAHMVLLEDDANLDTRAVRVAEDPITTTALSGNVYTVPNGAKFMKGEIVPVLSSASVQKGGVTITEIDGDNLTVSDIKTFTKESGDILVLREDSFIPEGYAEVVDTGDTPFAIINADSSVKIIVDLKSQVKKKA